MEMNICLKCKYHEEDDEDYLGCLCSNPNLEDAEFTHIQICWDEESPLNTCEGFKSP